jgi:hypothetical protein
MSGLPSIELFHENKYRELDYGTLYFVAGRKSPEINAFVQRNANRIARLLNENKDYWVNCKIVWLDSDNPLFAAQEQAAIYSAMLPIDDTDGYPFYREILEGCVPEDMCIVFDAYFRSLLELFDEVLDGEPDEPEDEWYEEDYAPADFKACAEDVYGEASAPMPMPMFKSAKPRCKTAAPFLRPSRLEITPDRYDVLLPDYHREIHFTAQVKALYVLFLNHPEGIRMKEIADYKEEYKQLYFYLTNRSDTDKLRSSVERLLDVCNPNALNVKKSQCNEALCRAIPEDDLRDYYEIEVVRGKPHRIKLDRRLVSIPLILKQ